MSLPFISPAAAPRFCLGHSSCRRRYRPARRQPGSSMNGATLTIAHHALERSWFSQSAKTPRIRRTFEDEFVVKLKAAGVDAAPSYRYIPEEGQTAEAQMLETVKQADADAAVITRFVRVEKKTDVTPGFYRPAPAVTFGFYPGYSAAWWVITIHPPFTSVTFIFPRRTCMT
jgi:hypothetical protein